MNRFALACGVALLMNCSPDYQSGSTECSPSGTCPDGFVCGDANSANTPSVCYQTDKTTCSSAGTYYCPESATCWAAQPACDTVVICPDGTHQACDSEGYTPDCSNSGKCTKNGSTGAGGSGGSGGGGGGGGSGGSGGSTTGPCAPVSTDTACDTCMERTCCPQLTACANQTSCVSLATCLNNCSSGNTTCISSCASSNSTGVTTLTNFDTCVTTSCSSSCN
jgi:hypothetical protein